MKFTILEGKKIEKEKEKEIRLYLSEGMGTVVLKGIDNAGYAWSIFEFKDGKFKRNRGIGKDKGLEIDEDGRIKEEEYFSL